MWKLKSSLLPVMVVGSVGLLSSCAHTDRSSETTTAATNSECRGPAAAPGGKITCDAAVEGGVPGTTAQPGTAPAAPERVVLTTDQMRKAFDKYDDRIQWRSWLDDQPDVIAFISQSHYDSLVKSGQSGLSAYGVENYVAYKDALDFVNGVPIGQLKLTPEFILECHRRLTINISKWLKDIDNIIPEGEGLIPDGYLPDDAAYKKVSNFGVDPLKYPINEEIYNALKANQWIEGFAELPYPLSRPGKRRGLIRYATKSTYMDKLHKLNDWYEQNKNVIDPVDLAARYAYRFVSIHPMKDGNGRTMLLLMNRILREKGIPPFARTNSESDIYMPEDQWVDVVRAGISDYVMLAKDMEWKEIPSIYNTNFKDAPRVSIYPETATNRATQTQLQKVDNAFRQRLSYMSRKLFPNSKEAVVSIGNRSYLFAMDGFFYDNKGIPHQLHEGKLYPIADSTYLLYGENGRVSPRRFSKRMLTEPHRRMLSTHFKFLLAVDRGDINPSQIEVVDYKEINDANQRGEIYLYDWQKDVFENAIRIRDEDARDPLATLTTMRGYSTTFEKGFAKDYAFTGADVVAQYQLADMRFQGYYQFAKRARNKEWIAQIEASRAKLHQAARSLLAVVDANFAKLSPVEQDYYRQHPKWKFYEAYKAQTALNYATYAEARENIPQGQYTIIRADNSIPRWVGFRSRQAYLDMARKIPGFDKFKQWILEAHDSIVAGTESKSKLTRRLMETVPYFKSLVPKVAQVLKTNRFDVRGADPEFARLYVDHYLHAVNSPLKQAVSFSTATDLYIRTKDADDEPALSQAAEGGGVVAGAAGATAPAVKEHVPFSTEGLSSKVYFVRVNAGDVGQNFASKYFRQYEVLGLKPISPFRIIKTFEEGFFKVPAAPAGMKSDFLTNGYLINPSKG